MACEILSAEDVRSLLDYDPATGTFRWKVCRSRVAAGDVAGVLAHGYTKIKINQVAYPAHRLAWLATHGEWPLGHIDHIDGNRSNNAIANLRDVSAETNQQNRRGAQRNNKTGYLGVSKASRSHRFNAFISIKGKTVCLGLFDTAEDASEAYLQAKRSLHNGCTI